jgi:hypothetical protein
MKKIKLLFMIASFATLLFFVGCKPTPDNDIVIQKEDLISESQPTTENSTYNSEQNISENDMGLDIDIPQEWNVIKELNDNITLHIDATPIYDASYEYNVYPFEPVPFTQEEVNKIVPYLADGQKLYRADVPPSKEELEDELIKIQRDYHKFKTNSDIDLYDQTVTSEYFEELIDGYEAAISNAEDTPAPEINMEDYSDNNTLNVKFYGGENEEANIVVSDDCLVYKLGEGLTQADTYDAPSNSIPDFTKEEAANISDSLLSDMSINGFVADAVLLAVNPVESFYDGKVDASGYCIVYTKKIDNSNLIYTGFPQVISEEQDFTKIRHYELIYVYVDQKGVRGFEWQGHGNIGESISGNTDLLNFSQIEERLNQHLINLFTYSEDDTILKTELNIDEAELGYMLIPRANRESGMILVPSWFFRGRIEKNYEDETYEENRNGNIALDYRPIIVINAIDGSYIPTVFKTH